MKNKISSNNIYRSRNSNINRSEKKITFKQILLSLSFLFFLNNGYTQNSILNNFLNDRNVINAPVGISVVNIDNGETVINHNANLVLTPASVQKLITSAAALEILGSDFTFDTHLATNGFIKERVLYGDVIIIGGGDPSLGSEYFANGSKQYAFLNEWCMQLKLAGIDSITGGIITDSGIFDDNDIPGSWTWEDMGNYYGAPARGISFSDNMARISFQSDSLPSYPTTINKIIPKHNELSFINLVTSSEDKRDLAYVFGEPDATFRVIKGTIPAARKAFTIKSSLPNPENVLKGYFIDQLKRYGIKIGNSNNFNLCTLGFPSEAKDTIYTHHSPKLDEIIQQLNFESLNLYAEHLLKYMGYYKYGKGESDAGIKAIEHFWESKGIDENQLHMADGSGLSRKNALSAKVLTDVLSKMRFSPANFQSYHNSIPRVGIEGTQLYYFQKSKAKGKFRAKSGSMTRVRSFAGYMTTANGNNLAFAVIINNFPCGSFTMAKKLEKLLEEVYYTY